MSRSTLIKGRSLSLHEMFDEERSNFIASPCHQRLLNTLAQNRPSGGWNISTAILIGVESLVNEDKDESRSQLFQLVVFLEVVHYLQKSTNSTVELFAQEPEFEDAAIDFVESFGFDVLWEPEAEELIREGCFTMAPFFGWDDTLLGRERHLRPTLYIGLPHEHVKSHIHDGETPQEMQWLNACGFEYNRFRLCPVDCAHAALHNTHVLEVYCSRTSEQSSDENGERDDSPMMGTQQATQGRERYSERKTKKVDSDDS